MLCQVFLLAERPQKPIFASGTVQINSVPHYKSDVKQKSRKYD